MIRHKFVHGLFIVFGALVIAVVAASCDRGPDYSAESIDRSTVEGIGHALCASLMNPTTPVLNKALREEDFVSASTECNKTARFSECGGIKGMLKGCPGVPNEFPQCSTTKLKRNFVDFAKAVKTTSSKCECVVSEYRQITCKTYNGTEDSIVVPYDDNNVYYIPLNYAGIPVSNAYKAYLLDRVVEASGQ